MQEDPNKITYFAKTDTRGKETPFGIKRRDRARHMYVIGKTGMGKSTLLENMAIQDIRNGEGMAFIDPHGSTVDRLLEYVPEHRIKDVIYFAPFDMEHPVAFNVMEDVGYDKRHLVVSGLMSAFKKLWVDAWSARMEYILSNTLLALLEYEGSTLLDVNTMYTNKAFRKKVVDNCKDTIVKKFWTEEFANFTDRFAAEATPAIQNKVGQFTSNPLIRNIIGQPKSSFDIRQAMDDKKILIINLSKGRVGEVNASLLGSMIVTKIYLAAMSRADVPANVLANLPNFYFYVDEFQNFANESFADILSEARKYKLNLLIAHQYVEQMEEEVRDAVFGNVGTTVAFRVGPFDAEVLETVFQPQFMATDLVNLGFAQIYLTLMIDGVGSPPFSATTLAPFDPPPQTFVPQVIASSRQLYGRARAEVEEVIRSWNAPDPAPASALTPRTPAPQSASSVTPVRPRTDAPRPPQGDYPLAPRPVYRPDRPAPSREPVHEKSAQELGRRITLERPDAVRPTPTLAPEQVNPAVAQSVSTSSASLRPATPVPHAPTPALLRPVMRRPEPKVEEPRPPLEGAMSLRDALRQVAQKTEQKSVPPPASRPPEIATPQPTPARVVHMPDLKETLGKIVNANQTSKPQSAANVVQVQAASTPSPIPTLATSHTPRFEYRPQPQSQRPSPQPARAEPEPQAQPQQEKPKEQPSATKTEPGVHYSHTRTREPAGLPEDVMRNMLAVDGFETKDN